MKQTLSMHTSWKCTLFIYGVLFRFTSNAHTCFKFDTSTLEIPAQAAAVAAAAAKWRTAGKTASERKLRLFRIT